MTADRPPAGLLDKPSKPVRLTSKERKPGQNFGMAAYWYREAAEQGVPEAQCSLGMLYLRGQGVPFDLAAAKVWFNKAKDQGHEISAQQLEIMDRWEKEEAAKVEQARLAEQALFADLGDDPPKKSKKKKRPKKVNSRAHLSGAASDAASACDALAEANKLELGDSSQSEELKKLAADKIAALSQADIDSIFDETKFVDDDDDGEVEELERMFAMTGAAGQ